MDAFPAHSTDSGWITRCVECGSRRVKHGNGRCDGGFINISVIIWGELVSQEVMGELIEGRDANMGCEVFEIMGI